MDPHNRRRWRSQVSSTGQDHTALEPLLDPVAVLAAAGDLNAVEDLIWAISERRLVRPTIRRLVVGDEDAEEVEQDVLVAVAETVDGFRAEARFTTWLHQVARYKAIAHLRRRRPTEPLPDDIGDAARISSVIATRDLDDAIGGLPVLYRSAVVLRDVQHRPYDEIARELAVNTNTAKTRVARGRALAAARLRGLR